MSFEEERLSILQRVSNGELSPKDGQLEIAMLKVKYQQGQEPGLEPAQPMGQRDDEPFYQVPPIHNRGINLPIAVAIAIPLLMIAGVMLVGLALFLALPAYAVLLVWNHLAPAQHWPMLTYWPTLGLMMLAFILLTVAQWTRRLRVYINRPR